MARILISDQSPSRLVDIDTGGPSFSDVAVASAGFLCGVAVLDDGRVAVADRAANKVRIGDPGGGSWDAGPPTSEAVLARPTGVAVGVDQDLLVVDTGNRRLLSCPSSLSSADVIPCDDLQAPTSATQTADGRLWLVDQVRGLLVSETYGAWQPVVVPAPSRPGTRSVLVHVSQGVDGGVVVTDLGAARVLLVASDGTVTAVVDATFGTSDGGPRPAPVAAVCDADSWDPAVYVLEAGTNRLLTYRGAGGGWAVTDELSGVDVDGVRRFTRPTSMALVSP